MRENLAAEWFCGFGLSDRTPDHSFFGSFRKRLGTKGLMYIFNRLRASLKAAWYQSFQLGMSVIAPSSRG